MTAATIRDVAKYAGVGVGTVSRVLNRSPEVSDATRSKVLSAIEALDYTPNPIARRLSLGKSLAIGVMAPFFTRPTVVERLRGVERVIADSEYDLIVFNVESNSRRDDCFRRLLRQQRVDGLLLISLLLEDGDVQRLLETGSPAVLIGVSHPRLSHIVSDDAAGGREATAHLLALGHRKIGFIGASSTASFYADTDEERYTGYCQALAEEDVSLRPQYVVRAEQEQAAAREAAARLLTLPEPPTAIIASSDTVAVSVLEVAYDLELSVPEDLSVVGYGDIDMAEHLNLTTVRRSLFESGERGGELLLRTVQVPETEPEHITLPARLIERGTTGPVR